MVDLSARFADRYPTLKHAIAEGALRGLFEEGVRLSPDHGLDAVSWAAPVPRPEKIICIGVNYPDRNAEYKDGQPAAPYPSMFLRTERSFVGHERCSFVRAFPRSSTTKASSCSSSARPAGISRRRMRWLMWRRSLCNEGTLRDWVRHAKFNVTQGKNFEASGSLGPWLVPFVEEAQIADIRLSTRVNGELRQDDRTSRLIFGFRYLIAYI